MASSQRTRTVRNMSTRPSLATLMRTANWKARIMAGVSTSSGADVGAILCDDGRVYFDLFPPEMIGDAERKGDDAEIRYPHSRMERAPVAYRFVADLVEALEMCRDRQAT